MSDEFNNPYDKYIKYNYTKKDLPNKPTKVKTPVQEEVKNHNYISVIRYQNMLKKVLSFIEIEVEEKGIDNVSPMMIYLHARIYTELMVKKN